MCKLIFNNSIPFILKEGTREQCENALLKLKSKKQNTTLDKCYSIVNK